MRGGHVPPATRFWRPCISAAIFTPASHFNNLAYSLSNQSVKMYTRFEVPIFTHSESPEILKWVTRSRDTQGQRPFQSLSLIGCLLVLWTNSNFTDLFDIRKRNCHITVRSMGVACVDVLPVCRTLHLWLTDGQTDVHRATARIMSIYVSYPTVWRIYLYLKRHVTKCRMPKACGHIIGIYMYRSGESGKLGRERRENGGRKNRGRKEV